MSRSAAVGVHDDLSSRETGVAHGAAHHKTTGRIDIKLRLRADIAFGQVGADDLFNDGLPQVFGGDVGSMLGRDHNGGAPFHLAVLVIGHSDLALAVRAKPGERAALALPGQGQGQVVTERNGSGHQFLRLPAGIAEHHALIAGAGAVRLVTAARLKLVGGVYTHGDVGRLLVQRGEDGDAVCVKTVGGIVVADVCHCPADDGCNIYLGLGGDLPHDKDHAGSGGRLAGHTAHGVLSQHGVQNCVGDLVADLIGMSLSDGFRCKNSIGHGCLFLSFPMDQFSTTQPFDVHPVHKKSASAADTHRAFVLIFTKNRWIWHLTDACASAGCRASSGHSLRHS